MRKGIVIAAFAGLVAACIGASLSSAAVTVGTSGWTWGNPRPQGHTLKAIGFAGDRGYAVGDFGTIVRTDDGGESWSGIRTARTTSFSRLRVLGADTFVAGGGCVLLRSDDGGQTLRQLRFTPSVRCAAPLAAYSFANEDVGYLLRNDGTVLRTEDGGQRFAQRASVTVTGGEPGPPNDIWFTSAGTGVVLTGADVGGNIWRTTDGGGSWSIVANGRAFKGVFFVSPSTGYGVGDDVVVKTVDGGATWQPQPEPDLVLVSVRCAGEMNCVVVDSEGDVRYTTDGFATLLQSGETDPSIQDVTGLAAAYSSSTRAVAVGENGISWHSDDGGANFFKDYAAPLGVFSHVRATSESVAHAPGDGGKLARTINGGETWTGVGVPTTNRITDLSFPSASLGYAVDGQGSLYRTDNGGGSWAILGQPGPGTLAVWASPNGETVVLVGTFGLLRSVDGGGHFDQVPGKLGRSRYFDVDRIPGGVVAFGSKAIAQSVDGGETWKSVKRPPKQKLAELDFVDGKIGFALGSDGRVWRTGNRGTKWKELPGIGTTGGYALSFGDAQHGWVATNSFARTGGGHAWVFHTSDGGATWRPQRIAAQPLTADGVEAVNDTTGFALAGGSQFFATGSGGDAASPSSLSLKASGRKNNRVQTSGRLTPSLAGASVAVFARDPNSANWRRAMTTTDSQGRFKVTWKTKRLTFFVAQWAGDQLRNSAGSKLRKAAPKPPPAATAVAGAVAVR